MHSTVDPAVAHAKAGAAAAFPATHWSVVLSAAQSGSLQSQEALAKLCAAYWYPVYAFIRRRGHSSPEAEDLTQEFFARLLDKQYLAGITAEGGRFRSYLLTMVKHLLANEWQKLQAQKRGGNTPIFSLDLQTAEERYQFEAADHETPDSIFERRWASALLHQVVKCLGREYSASGRGTLFQSLSAYLSGDQEQIPYAALGVRLGLSEGAVKVAVHRLRKRYGELLRAEIAATLTDPQEIDGEIRHLIAAVSR